jgi:hypothetical protein
MLCAALAAGGAIVAVLLTAGSTAGAPAFRQDHRVDSFVLQYTTDAFAPNNQFGSAIRGSTPRSHLQTSFDDAVSDGSMSILLRMLTLDDLTGASDPSLNIGVISGVPITPAGNPAVYDGTSDLDWWYTQSASGADANGVPLDQLSGSIVANTLSVGPGTVHLSLSMVGAVTVVDARLEATTGAVSAPLGSTNGFPPGHLPAEAIDPNLHSFESMAGGKLAGTIRAASLASEFIPISFVGSGLTNCSQNYTIANTWLDLLVGGCTTIIGTQMAPTQPDQADPAAPPAGSGAPYTFTRTGNTVTGCKDHTSATVDLATCVNAAAYSSYFQFTSDRVIVGDPRTAQSVGGFAEQRDLALTVTHGRDSHRYVGGMLVGLTVIAALGLGIRRTLRKQP